MIGSFICMGRGVSAYDEGLILFGAQRVGAGDIPHRDFYANYGPGSFYVLSWLFKLFSPSVLVERVWDSGVRSAIAVLVFLLVRGSGQGAMSVIAGLVAFLWLSAYGFYGYPVFPVLALALASALALVPVFAGDRRPWRLVLAGVLVGGVGLFRYDAAFAACVCTMVVLLAFAIGVPAGSASRSAGRLLVPFVAGVAMVAGPLGIYDLLTGTLPDLWLDVVLIPARSYTTMRSLPPPDWGLLLYNPLEIGSYIPMVIAAVATVVLVNDGRNSRAKRPLFWLALLLLLFTFVFIAKGYVRFSALHMSMALVTSVAMLGCLAGLRSCVGRLRSMVLGAGLGIGLGTLPALGVDIARASFNAYWLARGADCSVPPGLDRLRCFVVDPDTVRAISYIRSVTEPGTPLFVGLGRHDKILLNDVAFYFLADRSSATKWHHMDPGVQTTEPIQREMIAELRAKAPPFIVLETAWDDAHEPNGSAISSGVMLLDDYLHDTYRPAETFGAVQIWARREPPLPVR